MWCPCTLDLTKPVGRGNEERQTQTGTPGARWSGLSIGETTAPQKFSTLTTQSWAERWRYCRQLDKEAGLFHTDKYGGVVYDTELALRGNFIYSPQKQSPGHKHPRGEKAAEDIFCTHCHTSTRTQRKVFLCLWTPPQEEGFAVPPGVWGSQIFNRAVPMSTVHIGFSPSPLPTTDGTDLISWWDLGQTRGQSLIIWLQEF